MNIKDEGTALFWGIVIGVVTCAAVAAMAAYWLERWTGFGSSALRCMGVA